MLFRSGTTYSYTTRAVNINGSAYHPTGRSITRLAIPALPTPVNVDSGIKLTWSVVKGAKSYQVYRKTASGSWTSLASSVTATPYTDTTAVSGTQYYYSIRAVATGSSSYNTTGAAITRVATPAPPTAENLSNGIKLTWSAVSGAKSYIVYRRIGTGSWVRLSDVTSPTYTDTTAVAGTTYSYTTRAVNVNGSAYHPTGRSLPDWPPPRFPL